MLHHADGCGGAKFQRGFQESTTQVVAVEVVIRTPTSTREPNGIVCLAAIIEFDGQQAARTGIPAFVTARLVDHAKLIALTQVAQEIHLGTQDVGHLQGNRVWNARRVGSAEQRRLNRANGNTNLTVGVLSQFDCGEAFAFGANLQHLGDDFSLGFVARGVDIAQPQQRAGLVGRGLNRAPRIQLVDAASAGVVRQKALQTRLVQCQAL